MNLVLLIVAGSLLLAGFVVGLVFLILFLVKSLGGTEFGSITVGGETYDHDIVIRLSGHVKKRKKKLSKERYGTSHTVSVEEAAHIYDDGATQVIVGTGQHGVLKLSDEAAAYCKDKGCSVQALPTPDAVQAWNEADGKVIAMLHVTC